MAPRPADEFRILSEERGSTLRVQRSEFIAIAFPAATEDELKSRLELFAKEHHASRHLCWGHRYLDEDWELIERSSDAGEPSGTAGQPILNAIRSAELVNSAVVVARYFGGVKLGTGGLVRAYSRAASSALEESAIKLMLRRVTLRVSTTFPEMNEVYRLVDPPHVEIVRESFTDEASFLLAVRESRLEALLSRLRELRIDVESE